MELIGSLCRLGESRQAGLEISWRRSMSTRGCATFIAKGVSFESSLTKGRRAVAAKDLRKRTGGQRAKPVAVYLGCGSGSRPKPPATILPDSVRKGLVTCHPQIIRSAIQIPFNLQLAYLAVQIIDRLRRIGLAKLE